MTEAATRLDVINLKIKPLNEESKEKKQALLQYMVNNNIKTHETRNMVFKCSERTKKPSLTIKNLTTWLEDFESDSFSTEELLEHIKSKQEANRSDPEHKLSMKRKQQAAS